MTILAGVDLAWTTTHESGVCLIASEGVDAPVSLLSLESRRVSARGLADELASLGADVVAAIDAPLIRRDGCVAERELGRAFGRFKAGAYLASVAFLESRKPPLTAGLLLGEALCARGFELDPLRLRPAGDGRFALEMYPHAFHVVAFGLSERLAYKKGRRGRRLEAFAAYQAALRLLAAALAPSLLHERAIAAVLDGEALRAHGAALKSLEDRLDAFTCALAALTAWRLGIEPADVFGDRRTGYIAVPGLHREPRFMARMMSG